MSSQVPSVRYVIKEISSILHLKQSLCILCVYILARSTKSGEWQQLCFIRHSSS